MVGGLAACQQYLPGPQIKRQKAMCCDSVAMRAVSRCCQLKSLRNERWRRPLSRIEIGERAVPTRKEVTTPVNGPLYVQCSVWRSTLVKSDTRKEAPLQRNGRVRPTADIRRRERDCRYAHMSGPWTEQANSGWHCANLATVGGPQLARDGSWRRSWLRISRGYSRLAGADEGRTLARLRGLRGDLIDPAIAAKSTDGSRLVPESLNDGAKARRGGSRSKCGRSA